MGNRKGNKKKSELVFSEKDRSEFLRGFTKRKNQRKKVAQDSIQKKFKEELRVQREKAKEIKSRYVKSFSDIKEGYLRAEDEQKDEVDDDEEENFETDQVTVSVMPISTMKSSMDPRKMFEKLEKQNEKSELIMNLNDEKDDDEEQEKTEDPLQNITSKKDLNKIMKQTAKSFMKKSKVVQAKNIANHKKNVKQSQRKKFKIEKKLKKHKKIKHKFNNTKIKK